MKKAATRKPKHKPKRKHAHRQASARPVSVPAPRPLALSLPIYHRDSSHPWPTHPLLDSAAATARATIGWLQERPRAVARSIPLSPEDRDIAVLLLAPFFILAVALAGNEAAQLARHIRALIAQPVAPILLPQSRQSTEPATPAPVSRLTSVHGAGSPTGLMPVALAPPPALVRAPKSAGPEAVSPVDAKSQAAAAVPKTPNRPLLAALPQASATLAMRTPQRIELAARDPGQPVRLSLLPQTIALAPAPGVALPSALPAAPPTPSHVGPEAFASLYALDEDAGITRSTASLYQRCSLQSSPLAGNTNRGPAKSATAPLVRTTWFGSPGATSFGERLARTARGQLDDLVIYDASYRGITYPHGDIPKLYGACTDVVIRAYRDLGIDLQVAVQAARVGSGDRNIDHRRTETLRRFFQRHAENLPVTGFAEDYLPGDIVTYARPQNTGTASRSHIALVSDVTAPSGRPMILHNRGWGPQLEDALFVDQITGHYRYSGETPAHAAPLPNLERRTSRRHAAAATRSLSPKLPAQ